MKKINKTLAIVICCGVIVLATAGIVLADPVIAGGAMKEDSGGGPGEGGDDGTSWATATVIIGPVMQVNDEYLLVNSISDDGTGPVGAVSIRIDPDYTLIADGTDGYPAALSEIKEGEMVYAYVGAAMTLSLPPQLSASMVICDIPDDGSTPLFTKVVSLEDNGGGSYKLTVAGGAVYTVPADCMVRPYLTRNIVTLADIGPGSNCLIWYDAQNTVSKIVIIQQ